MNILFNYLELVILQDDIGRLYVVSLFDENGKVVRVCDIFGITNEDIIGAITSVMWNNLGSNKDIVEYIDEYKKSKLYQYTEKYNNEGE